jgi:hypothetical protein
MRTLTFFKSEALLYAVQKHNCKTWAKINLQLHTVKYTQAHTHEHTHISQFGGTAVRPAPAASSFAEQCKHLAGADKAFASKQVAMYLF